MSSETTTSVRTFWDLAILSGCAAIAIGSRWPENIFFSYHGIHDFIYGVMGSQGNVFVEHATAAAGSTALLTVALSGVGNTYRRLIEHAVGMERDSKVRNKIYGVSCVLAASFYYLGSLKYELWQGEQRGEVDWNQVVGDTAGILGYAALVARETSRDIGALVRTAHKFTLKSHI